MPTFTMCSLLSANKDVTAMVHVKNLTAEYVKVCTLKVITMLENAGYYVFCLISDNNRVNRNMFADLCGPHAIRTAPMRRTQKTFLYV